MQCKAVLLIFLIQCCWLHCGLSFQALVHFSSSLHPEEITFYEIYVPDSYSDTAELLPAFVFLIGAGEWGTDTETLLYHYGPFEAMKFNDGQPIDNIGMENMIFITPNMPKVCNFNTDVFLVHEALEHATSRFRIDLNRVTFAGVSTGGLGVIQYIAAFPNTVAAAVVMSGANRHGTIGPEESDGCFLTWVKGPADIPCEAITDHVHLWLIHGTDDYAGFWINPYSTQELYQRLISCFPSPKFVPRFSFVEGARHGVPLWQSIFRNTGKDVWDTVPPGTATLKDFSVYQWPAQFSLPSVALEPTDQTPLLDTNGVGPDLLNLVRLNRAPRVTASSLFSDGGQTNLPTNAVDGNSNTAWIPDQTDGDTLLPNDELQHFLIIDFIESVRIQKVMIRSRVKELSWKITLSGMTSATTTPDSAVSIFFPSPQQQAYEIWWNRTELVDVRMLQFTFAGKDSSTSPPEIVDIEAWGLLSNHTADASGTTIDFHQSTTVVTASSSSTPPPANAAPPPPPFRAPVYDNITASNGFVACYCDDFEIPIPASGTDCGQASSQGWASDWISKFVSIASPTRLANSQSLPWNWLQGNFYLRLQSATDDKKWDCLTSRHFQVQAGVAVQMKFLMAVPRPRIVSSKSVNLLRIETKGQGEVGFVERAVVFFPPHAIEPAVVRTVHLGIPRNDGLLEIQFSVLSTDHRKLFYNIDNLMIEMASSSCPN